MHLKSIQRRSIFLKEEPQTKLHIPEPIKEKTSILSPESSPAMANRKDFKSAVPKIVKPFEEESTVFEQDLEGEPSTYTMFCRLSCSQVFCKPASPNGQTHFKNLEN